MFRDRTDAGRQLADLLDDRDVEADVVLAIPRGGLPVARPVADALGVPLDVIAASKIGAPDDPELAVGAVVPRRLIGTAAVDGGASSWYCLHCAIHPKPDAHDKTTSSDRRRRPVAR